MTAPGRLTCGWFLLLCAMAFPAAAQDKASARSDQAELERKFSEKMTGSTLVGTFSVEGKEDETPKAERYELVSVTKLGGDLWIFTARIKYGKTDATIPITLPVLWAGDTPVISLTNFSIPGMGTFTARVLFYEDRYVGTWQHGPAGGHMWGRIEKSAPKTTDEPAPPKSDSP